MHSDTFPSEIQGAFQTITAHFQPVFNTSFQIVGYECLARVNTNGAIKFPVTLITNLTPEEKISFDLHMLNQACAFLSKLNSRNLKNFPFVSINLFPETLASEGLMQKINQIMNLHNTQGFNEQIKFEVLETPFAIQDIPHITYNLGQMREYYHPIVLDDYGQQDSDIARLQLLRNFLTGIKIDKSFLSLSDTQREYFLAGISAKNLEITIEGVDTTNDAAIWHRMGMDIIVQGWGFCRDLSPDDALRLLEFPLVCNLHEQRALHPIMDIAA